MSATVRIVPFDVRDSGKAEFDAYYRVAAACQELDQPGEDRLTYDDVVSRLKNPIAGYGERLQWLGYQHDRPVAIVAVDLLEGANSHIALVEISVHPRERRQGIGTEVLRAILDVLHERHRSLVEGWELAKGGPGELWAKAVGFDVANTMHVQTLMFADVDRSRWGIGTSANYHLRQWSGTTPEDLIASYARARSAIHDAPTGESTYQPPQWTAAHVRKTEAELREKGVEHRVVVAVENATGEVAGMTEIDRYPHLPHVGAQRDTVVLASHRGHGLGASMKAQMLRWLVAEYPQMEKIVTGTNEENTHMQRVNAQLGFVTTRVVVTVHQGISVLQAVLATH